MALQFGAHTNAHSASSSALASGELATSLGSGVIIGITFQGGTFLSLTDSFNNAPPIQIGVELGSTQKARLYYFPVLRTAGGGHTFTLNLSAGSIVTMYVQEILCSNGNGLLLDQQTSGDDTVSPFGNGFPLTINSPVEVVIAVAHWAAGGIVDPDTWSDSLFTLLENQTVVSTELSGAMSGTITSSLGTYAANLTSTQATTARMHVASFSEVDAGGITLWAQGML
jgi:hypothetical protein